jgi:hypothetical protein
VATTQKRAQPATHITVWIGLALSIVGLLIAMYAYSGTRVYDIGYAYVAVAGGVVAMAGILVSAWGRSIMAARASRIKRETIHKDALMLTEAGLTETRAPPTVAEPAEKKRFSFSLPSLPSLPMRKRREAPAVEGGAASGSLFAFRTRDPPPAAPEPEPLRSIDVESLTLEAPMAEIAREPASLERVTLRCPSCASQFSAEGMRPFAATCPSCGFSATI